MMSLKICTGLSPQFQKILEENPGSGCRSRRVSPGKADPPSPPEAEAPGPDQGLAGGTSIFLPSGRQTSSSLRVRM